jgi:hypothetical protein
MSCPHFKFCRCSAIVAKQNLGMLTVLWTLCIVIPTASFAHDCEKLWHEATVEYNNLFWQALDGYSLQLFDAKGNIRHRPKAERTMIATAMRTTLVPAYNLAENTTPIPGCEKLFEADRLIMYHLLKLLDKYEAGDYRGATLEQEAMNEQFAAIGRFKEDEEH